MSNSSGVVTRELRSPNYVSFYSNNSKQRLSPFDVVLTFSVINNPPNEEAFIEELCSVTFSPQHFKLLLAGMTTTLKTYESQFGEIKGMEQLQLKQPDSSANFGAAIEEVKKAIAAKGAEADRTKKSAEK